jgi:hypothetical protein
MMVEALLFAATESLHGQLLVYKNCTLTDQPALSFLPAWASFFSGGINARTEQLGNSGFSSMEASHIAELLDAGLKEKIKALSRSSAEELWAKWQHELGRDSLIRDAFSNLHHTFDTNRGPTDIRSFRPENNLFVSAQIDPNRKYYKGLFDGVGTVFHANSPQELATLNNFAREYGVSVTRVDVDNQIRFPRIDLVAKPTLRRLVDLAKHSPLVRKVRLVQFQASATLELIPALLMPPEMDATVESGLPHLGSLGSELLSSGDNFRSWRIGVKDWTLLLNANHPLMERLQTLDEDSLGLQIGLREVFHVAYLFATDTVDETLKDEAWQNTIELIDRVCTLESRIRQLEEQLVESAQNHARTSDEKSAAQNELETTRSELLATRVKLDRTQVELQQVREQLAASNVAMRRRDSNVHASRLRNFSSPVAEFVDL